jgi:hypothetical protein
VLSPRQKRLGALHYPKAYPIPTQLLDPFVFSHFLGFVDFSLTAPGSKAAVIKFINI